MERIVPKATGFARQGIYLDIKIYSLTLEVWKPHHTYGSCFGKR